MTSSWKIGAKSGLIAGIIAGIFGAISTIFVMGIGLPFYLHISDPFRIPVLEIFSIEIILSIIFGILLGIIFLKTYDYIPGKRFSKYIVYGLFCHLIVGIRELTFSFLTYSGITLQTLYENAFWIIIGFPQWIAYGLVLGLLCEFLVKRKHVELVEKKIDTGNMGTGAMIGASVGVIAGIVAVIFIIVHEYFIGSFVPPSIQDISVIIYRFGAHVFPHLIYGAIFGAIFARVYDIIPGKGVMKGLFYSYVIFLISTVHQGALHLAYAAIQPSGVSLPLWGEVKSLLIILGTMWIFVDIFVYAAYGTLIGILYKKPSD